MRISTKQLLGLPVETEDGAHIGSVVSCDVDIDTHHVETYHAKSGRLLSGLFHGDLLIHPTEIISITAEKMIVQGAVRLRAEQGMRVPTPFPATEPSPTLQSKQE